MTFHAVPERAWYTNLISPAPVLDGVKIGIPTMLIGAAVASAMHDWIPLLLALIIAAAGYFVVGRRLIPYQLPLGDERDLEFVIAMLDGAQTLRRRGKELRWFRRGFADAVHGETDILRIDSDADSKWTVRGRRDDLSKLAAALNGRR